MKNTSFFHDLNEHFASLADLVSEGLGHWSVSAIAFMLIALWTVFCAVTQGSSWWYSSFYNFPLNLVTTVAELFIGFLIAAAANRVERHNRDLLVDQLKITQHIDRTNQEEEQELHAAEQRLQWQDDMMRAVLDHLDQQDHTMMQMLERIDALLEHKEEKRAS